MQQEYLISIVWRFLGRKTDTIVTVTGVERIQTNNLKLDLLESKTNKVLGTFTLTPRRRSKAHFTVSFSPPSSAFRFEKYELVIINCEIVVVRELHF